MPDETDNSKEQDETPFNKGYYANVEEDRPKSDCPYSKYDIGAREKWIEGWEWAEEATSWTKLE